MRIAARSLTSKKAPVIDFLRRHAPEGEAISLIAEERVERVETARVARRPVDDGEGLLDRLLHGRRFLGSGVPGGA